MSLHSVRPEVEALVRKQRRNSIITSGIIGLLTLVLMMILLSLYLLAPLFKETPTIVTYESSVPDEEQEVQKKVIQQIRPKPPSASSAVAKVIAANTSSPTAIPVPDVEVEVMMDGFGSDGDFGEGWASGNGSGAGGGATFFNQQVKADRIAYVIDYSASMRGDRERLMRKELGKSIKGLQSGMSYQMIFFAGPTWVAGDDVTMAKDRKSAEVKSGSGTFDWTSSGGAHNWKPKGKKREPQWILSGASERRKSIKLVEDTKLVYGTDWEPALETALAMDPPPQVIFFMTDGVTGNNATSLAKKIGAMAKTRNIVINTVAMMEPRAQEAMKELAKRTNGQFTIIEKNGKVRTVKTK